MIRLKNSVRVHMLGNNPLRKTIKCYKIFSSSRENSPEIRRRTFGGVQNRNNSFLSPSPLASPYGSRSNSPARNSSYNNSPGFQRRLTTQSTGSNDKWSLRNIF